jgi:predicted GNAT family acetyltransferase
MPQIKHLRTAPKGAFIYEVAGQKLAEMVYTMAGETKMIIEHTDVDESLKGQGIGKQLLAAVVEYVRANGIKVIPLCPFANTMLKRMKEWQDILM